MKNIAICGASGYIGARLTQYLKRCGYRIKLIERNHLEESGAAALSQIINSCDTVINLAGSSIAKRWSRKNRLEIRESRIVTTRTLVKAINASKSIKLFISASAAGHASEDMCDKKDCQELSDSFLSNLCRLWEQEARGVRGDIRLAIVRFGLVFSKGGGVFERLISTKKYGFIVQIGSAHRRLSWIDREDVIRAIEYIGRSENLSGAINLVAPEHTTQQQFITTVKRRWKLRFTIYIPPFMVRLIFGASSQTILWQHCAEPRLLLDSGFRFLSPNISKFIQR